MTTNDRKEDLDAKIVAAPMPAARFKALIATYGAAPDRWPDAERAAAEALVERSAGAREAVADAALLDSLLDIGEAPPPSEETTHDLQCRFIEARDGRFRFLPHWRIPRSAWMSRPAVALAGIAALVVVGLVLGRGTPDPATTANGSTLARVLPPIELGADGADGFIGEDGAMLEPQIALIESSAVALGDEDSAFEQPASEPLLAFAPSLEELPLE